MDGDERFGTSLALEDGDLVLEDEVVFDDETGTERLLRRLRPVTGP